MTVVVEAGVATCEGGADGEKSMVGGRIRKCLSRYKASTLRGYDTRGRKKDRAGWQGLIVLASFHPRGKIYA
jgi:hypothetical protein